MLKAICKAPASRQQSAADARRIADTASARHWLAEGAPIADVLTMLEVSRRFELSPHVARAYAVEILSLLERRSTAPITFKSRTERSSSMPLLEIIQSQQVSATIRLDKTTAEQIDQYATFLHASADEVVDKALAYVFAKDRDFQEYLRSPESARAAQSLRVRRSPQNGDSAEPQPHRARVARQVEAASDSRPRSRDGAA